MRDLYDLGFISLKETCYYPTAGCEFYITLSRNGFMEQRLDALKTIKAVLSL